MQHLEPAVAVAVGEPKVGDLDQRPGSTHLAAI